MYTKSVRCAARRREFLCTPSIVLLADAPGGSHGRIVSYSRMGRTELGTKILVLYVIITIYLCRRQLLLKSRKIVIYFYRWLVCINVLKNSNNICIYILFYSYCVLKLFFSLIEISLVFKPNTYLVWDVLRLWLGLGLGLPVLGCWCSWLWCRGGDLHLDVSWFTANFGFESL